MILLSLFRPYLALALILAAGTATAQDAELRAGLEGWAASHRERFGDITFVSGEVPGCGEVWHIEDPQLAMPATGPMVMDHGEVRDDVVVLYHGLSDSPFYLCTLGRILFDAGANVVLPLMTGMGRAKPMPEAHTPDLAERWLDDGRAALAFARTRGKRVSAGGLSTGGVVAVRLWAEDPSAINGGLLMFSAAFDFTVALRAAAACTGTLDERNTNAFRRWCYRQLAGLTKWREEDMAWRQRNPYRNLFSIYGALELGILRRDALASLEGITFDAPLFIAHSLQDTTAPIAGVRDLADRHAEAALLEEFIIDDVTAANCSTLMTDCVSPRSNGDTCGVPHASVVLAETIYVDGKGSGKVCEPANPKFNEMTDALLAFMANLPATSD